MVATVRKNGSRRQLGIGLDCSVRDSHMVHRGSHRRGLSIRFPNPSIGLRRLETVPSTDEGSYRPCCSNRVIPAETGSGERCLRRCTGGQSASRCGSRSLELAVQPPQLDEVPESDYWTVDRQFTYSGAGKLWRDTNLTASDAGSSSSRSPAHLGLFPPRSIITLEPVVQQPARRPPATSLSLVRPRSETRRACSKPTVSRLGLDGWNG